MRNRNFFSNRQAASITQLLAENEKLRRLERGIFMWMLRFTQGYVSLPTVTANLQRKLDERSIQALYNCVFNKPRHYRNRALTILFYFYRISNTDICPTGALLWACLAFVGAWHQLRRFFALEPKDEGEERSIW